MYASVEIGASVTRPLTGTRLSTVTRRIRWIDRAAIEHAVADAGEFLEDDEPERRDDGLEGRP